MRALAKALTLSALVAGPALAQDPTVVDAKHYTVEFENDHVRVIRIKYGPGEKSVMHDHARYVVVNVTDASVKFTTPDPSLPTTMRHLAHPELL
jgi:quercetin dioxygenase-like cupin family protein